MGKCIVTRFYETDPAEAQIYVQISAHDLSTGFGGIPSCYSVQLKRVSDHCHTLKKAEYYKAFQTKGRL